MQNKRNKIPDGKTKTKETNSAAVAVIKHNSDEIFEQITPIFAEDY